MTAAFDDPNERIDGVRHPRMAARLFGHEEPTQRFLEAFMTGRMPHAWLLAGSGGIGKATFAYRAAKCVFSMVSARFDGAALPTRFDPFILPTVDRAVTVRSHLNLHVLEREPDPQKKTMPLTIPVENVRKMIGFFESTAGQDGWRVAVIDSMDELGGSAANALLKLIEEPPPRSLFLMTTSMPGRLLPTIRSRCRVLSFRPLSTDDVASAVSASIDRADPEMVRRAAAYSGGSVKAALRFLDPAMLTLLEQVGDVLTRLPDLDRRALIQLADSVQSRDRSAEFGLVCEVIQGWLADQCHKIASELPRNLAPLAEVWEKNQRSLRETERYNLDRRPLLMTMFADLAEAVRQTHSV